MANPIGVMEPGSSCGPDEAFAVAAAIGFGCIELNGYRGALILETRAGDDARASAGRNLEFVRKHFNA